MAALERLPLLAGLLTALAGPALAQEIEPFADARARYQHLDVDGFDQASSALTQRLRGGAEWRFNDNWSLLGEAEAVGVLIADYNAAPVPGAEEPVIPDPAIADLNRLQLIYETDDLFASAGRLLIAHGDERFIGGGEWRQDDRTFDAASLIYDLRPGLTASYAWVWRVNQTLGTRNDAESSSHLAHLEWVKSGAFKASGFAYLIDLDDRPGTATFGARATGDLPAGPAVLTYDAALARQVDYNAGGDFTLDHASLKATLALGPVSAWSGYEMFEGDGVRGFDLPFASRHSRQGLADVFTHIPEDGVEDFHLGASARWPNPPLGRTLTFEAAHHWFDPSRGDADFGREWDLVADLGLTPDWGLELQYAAYDGGAGAPADRESLSLMLSWEY